MNFKFFKFSLIIIFEIYILKFLFNS
jgi:hypothetical protein